MPIPLRPRSRDDFEIAVICALQSEADTVVALFDKYWDEDGETFGKAHGDTNAYTTGLVGRHNVVLAHMPGMGKGSAASVAASFRSSFRHIKLALVVGICGGVPQGTDDEEEILLGDVIISDGLIQYDFGRQLPDIFMRKDTLMDSLGRPNVEIRAFLAKLRGMRGRSRLMDKTSKHLQDLCHMPGFIKSHYPGATEDKLYGPTYRHKHHNVLTCTMCVNCKKKEDPVCVKSLESTCLELKCGDDNLVRRRRLVETDVRDTERHKPVIHFGLIASGDRVMKSGEDRDEIAAKEKIIAFEMEGAGVWDNMPCIVIKGVCDYADSHKNKKWQNYAAATAAACMKAFLEEWVSVDKRQLDETTFVHARGRWVVPFGRNKQFVGRNSELMEVMAKLDPNDEEDCQRVAISGLGGMGKTQIALEAAFRIQKCHPDCSIFWVPAINTTTFERAYKKIGEKLKIAGIEEDKADAKSLVKTFLSQDIAGQWLMIIDNADDVGMLYRKADESNASDSSPRLLDYLPFSIKGSILFTTRDGIAAVKQAGVDVVTLKEMSQSDSLELLKACLIDKDLLGEKTAAMKLLQILACLPLAIKQAAAYLNENSASISEYLSLCETDEDQFVELLSRDFEDKGRYRSIHDTPTIKNPIALTWSISFRQILRRDILAAEYLFFMSCVAQQDIPDSLLPPARSLKKTDAIGILKAYAFITLRKGQRSYDMHRLVQIAVRNWLKEKDELRLWSGKTMQQIAEIFPFPKHENRETWMSYLPHTNYVLGVQDYPVVFRESLCKLLFNVGECFLIIGKYAQAETKYRQTLKLREKVLGSNHLHTLASKNNLAIVLRHQGKYTEAEEIQRQTLKSKEKVLGVDHPDTLGSKNNLAVVLRHQGKYTEAEEIQRQTLKSKEKVLGVDHPDTLGSKNNLAVVLEQQDKDAEAEQLYRQTLESRKKVFGIDHLYTLDILFNLKLVLKKQGKDAEAEQIQQQFHK